MNTFILFKYLHYVSIFLVVISVAIEAYLIKHELTRGEIRRLSRVDGLYGIGAILIVAVGLTLWLGVGKPAEYYSNNWIFLTKFGLFTLVGILSIYPTIFFARQRKGDQGEIVVIPGLVRNLIYVELAILFLIPLLAALMANGVGYQS